MSGINLKSAGGGGVTLSPANTGSEIVVTVPAIASTLLTRSDGASAAVYTPAGTGAIASTVQAKLRESVSVLDFGADPTGAIDSAPAFRLAIAAAKNIYVPTGTYSIESNISVTTPVRIYGDGVSPTVIERAYSPVADTQGVFAFSGGGTSCALENMTIRSKVGQTGGCLVSIVSGASDTLGLYRFEWVVFTTTDTSGVTGTHAYTVYLDGTAKTSSPIGIRGVDFTGCSLFGGSVSTLLVKGVLKFSFNGGGTYPAGGVATSNVRLDGTAGVPTSSFQFNPSDCSCPISFDRATTGIVSCGVMGAITNTSNTSNVACNGYSASVQTNWLASSFNYTDAASFLAVANAALSNVTGDNTTYNVLFQQLKYDKGSSFNLANGTFTVTRPGVYAVNWCLLYSGLGAAHTRNDTGLVHKNAGGSTVNATAYVSNPYAISASGFASITGAININCAVGDTLVLTANVSGSTKTVGIYGDTGTVYSWFAAQYVRE